MKNPAIAKKKTSVPNLEKEAPVRKTRRRRNPIQLAMTVPVNFLIKEYDGDEIWGVPTCCFDNI